MNIALLGNPGSWYVSELDRAAGECGHHCERIDYRELCGVVGTDLQVKNLYHGGEAVTVGDRRVGIAHEDRRVSERMVGDAHPTDFDAVIVRTMPPGSLEQVVFRMDALARLEAAGVAVLNSPRAIECAVDKYLATCKLAAAGLPVPETIVCQSAEAAMQAFETLGGDVVVKPVFGAEGRGIVRVSDTELAFRTFRTLERIQAVLYLQRFIEHEGYDVRVLVLDGRVLGAIRRRANGDFRTNLAKGGLAEPHSPGDVEVEWAVRAAAACGARFAGVDVLYGRDGAGYVVEVNAVPGWRGFAPATGLDVARCIVEAIESWRGSDM